LNARTRNKIIAALRKEIMKRTCSMNELETGVDLKTLRWSKHHDGSWIAACACVTMFNVRDDGEQGPRIDVVCGNGDQQTYLAP
jgi:hypothetical protein